MTTATNQTATVALTKQEILRNTLVAAPIDAKYGTAENRIAPVTLEGGLFVASYNDIEIARVKRPEDLANLLIDKKHTQKAKWANIAELNFLCEVPAGTPNKGGMKKAGGQTAQLKSAIMDLLPADLEKITKAELLASLTKIVGLCSAE